MKAFKNDNIIDKLCGGCDCTDFVPAVSFTYDAGAKTITFTDASVYGAGNDRKIVHLGIYDKNGEKVLGNISAADGDDAVALSTATLDASGGFKLAATVVTDNGCVSDGHAEAVGIAIIAGDLGYWDKDNTALTIGAVDSGS
jgi:hypothetical protein